MCSVLGRGHSSGPEGPVGVWPSSVGTQSSASEECGGGVAAEFVVPTGLAQPSRLQVGGQQPPGWDGLEARRPRPQGTLQPGRGRATSAVLGLKNPFASCPRGRVRQHSNWVFNARFQPQVFRNSGFRVSFFSFRY